MATFILFGKYSAEALKGVSAARTKKASALVKKQKGKVVGMYAMLGEKDLIFILELPGMEEAMKASVGLHKLTGIAFTTAPAVSVEVFDNLMAEL
ncbi:MAG: GYD domain-containing protein [Desulfomonilia bacterium]|jgi:uncharacterized protein with GYD domain